jgi:hypothetical protein
MRRSATILAALALLQTARDSATSCADCAARKLVPVLKAEGPEVAAWPVTLDLQPGWA